MKAKGRRGKGRSRQAGRQLARPKERAPQPAAKPYEYLPHPADVGFLARGKTLEKVFEAAARALSDYGWELARVRPRQEVEIHARAATLEDLLYSWLSEVLFLSDAERWMFRDFRVERVAAPSAAQPVGEVSARARGERFVKGRHRARTYIKAVTYHQLAVKQTETGWQATVYLDV